MRIFLAVLIGIPAVIIVVCLFMPVYFLGLIAVGIISIVERIQGKEGISLKQMKKKTMQEIEKQIGWKN